MKFALPPLRRSASQNPDDPFQGEYRYCHTSATQPTMHSLKTSSRAPRAEIIAAKHRPSMRVDAKSVQKKRVCANVYVFQLSFHFFCTPPLLVGQELRDENSKIPLYSTTAKSRHFASSLKPVQTRLVCDQPAGNFFTFFFFYFLTEEDTSTI